MPVYGPFIPWCLCNSPLISPSFSKLFSSNNTTGSYISFYTHSLSVIYSCSPLEMLVFLNISFLSIFSPALSFSESQPSPYDSQISLQTRQTSSWTSRHTFPIVFQITSPGYYLGILNMTPPQNFYWWNSKYNNHWYNIFVMQGTNDNRIGSGGGDFA